MLSDDFAKQVELGVGPDTCLYYGSGEGLKKRCAPGDTGTICDATLTFPVGIAFSTGGSFGTYMYVADYGFGDIHRSVGCSASSIFATVVSPGSIAFPPSGSAYGDYLYPCEAFSGPIYRVSSTGVVTPWLAFPTTYLKFGPGGAWGTGMYATEASPPAGGGIRRITSAGAVSTLMNGFYIPEGFDWGFDGDMFATDAGTGQIFRVKVDGTTTLFATLAGAADVAWRPGEKALYVVSNQGGLYRIGGGSATGVEGGPETHARFAVSPNPSRGTCALNFVQQAPGIARVSVVDAQGRRVRRLPESWRPIGAHSIPWDGRDDAGVAVRPGAYFMRVVTDGTTQSARVSIVR